MTESDNNVKATFWIGEEEEYESKGKTLFCDLVVGEEFNKWTEIRDEILRMLSVHSDVNEVYFAHGASDRVVESLAGRVQVTVEVTSVDQINHELAGAVRYILQVPESVASVKRVSQSSVNGQAVTEIQVTDFEAGSVTKREWAGTKTFESDTVLREAAIRSDEPAGSE